MPSINYTPIINSINILIAIVVQKNLNKENLFQIIDKYLNGNSTVEEEKHLINYYESFQENKQWVSELGLEDDVKEIIRLRILNEINKEKQQKGKAKIISMRSVLKYAAAIIMLVSITYFFTKENSFVEEPIIVNNNIEIGTDKATLTLEDGSNVVLEKGQQYVSDRANSDGENIIYSSKKNGVSNAKKELVFNYLTIPRGGEFYIELADATKVWLNSESKIKYPVEFIEGEPRMVELLYGEAYFDVSPSTEHNGDAFKLFSKGHEIEVLGTEFNVSAYKDEEEIITTLVEGKVAVFINNNTIELDANEQISYNLSDNTFSKKVVDVNEVTAWRKGYFHLNDQSLLKVTKLMSRWYDVDIIIENENLENIILRGSMRKNQNVEYILITFKNIKDISYEIKNDQIILK